MEFIIAWTVTITIIITAFTAIISLCLGLAIRLSV